LGLLLVELLEPRQHPARESELEDRLELQVHPQLELEVSKQGEPSTSPSVPQKESTFSVLPSF
jgi:hypothetical protein